MTEYPTSLHPDRLPDADAFFADATHWRDIHEVREVFTVGNEYALASAKIHVLFQKQDREGLFRLYTTNTDDKPVLLSQYLAVDLGRKQVKGTLTLEQYRELLAEGQAILQEYEKYGQPRHPDAAYPTVPNEDEIDFDWRDFPERAANEER